MKYANSDLRKTMNSVDDFIRSKFIYMPEQIETLVTPDYMLSGLEVNNHLTGDCDDISMFHATLLTCMGIKVRFVAIRSMQENPDYDHVFIEAHDGNEWRVFDATVPPDTRMEMFGRINIPI
jgi:transglutaminase-like putative cysteine protease